MDLDLARQRFLDIQQLATEGLAALVPTPQVFRVRAGESLTAALAQTLPIVVEAGAVFEGTYTLPSGRQLTFEAGAGIHAPSGPALYVAPGTRGVRVTGGTFGSAGTEAVIQIGENTERQTRIEDQPGEIILTGLTIPTFRGKRGLALHGTGIRVERVTIADVWSARDADSQGIYIGNAGGDIDVIDCDLSAGSQIILVGGDSVRTPGLHPTGLRFTGNRLVRPLSWMTDADNTKRRIKNSFELKDGIDVTFTGNVIDGNWSDPRVTQGCYAIVLTPALDGAISTPPKRSGVVGNVLMADNLLLNIGAGINLIGRHYTAITDQALYGVQFVRNRVRIERAKFGGFGQFCKIGGEPADLAFADNLILQDGSSHVYAYKGDVLDPVTGIRRKGGAIGSLRYERNVAELGAYGFNVDANANATADQLALNVGTWTTSGNTFKGAPRRGPLGGVFVSDADFDARPDVVALRAAS